MRGYVVRAGSSMSWAADDFGFWICHTPYYFLAGSQQGAKEDGFDSIQKMSDEEKIIVMYLYEQMVLHNPVQKVLEERKVMSVFVQKLGCLMMVDGKLSFCYHHIKELYYP